MAQEQQEGVVLGTMGKTTYVHVDYVFELDQRGRWTPYCPPAAWEESEAAIEARRLTRIAELEAELARLKAKPVASAEADLKPAPAAPAATRPTEAAPPTAPERVPRKHCGKEFNAGRGIAVHESKCNYRNRATLTAPLATLPQASPAIVALESEWRCAECNSDAFAADIKEPARCVRCTGAYTAALSRAS